MRRVIILQCLERHIYSGIVLCSRCFTSVQENELYPEKDVNHQDMLLTLLLNKHLPIRRPSHLELELENKLEELEQLEKLKEQILEEKSGDVSFAMDRLPPSHPNKRACFWKYCV
ncbi:urotensin-2B isoform X2 [Phyllobates terribilis]|uniref:urotensin-2B isoform X2 n=1 Tax=Phyllobates terribilis TaxID=111132 RepID=UPI003CCAFC50